MAKLFSILLSSLILIQSFHVSFKDFSRLKIMIEHFDYHQENFDESVMDFVSIHYGSDKILHSEDHEHHDEHENLPFKKDTQTNLNSSLVFVINNTSIELNNNSSIELSHNFFYREMHSLFEKPLVFQPPRQA